VLLLATLAPAAALAKEPFGPFRTAAAPVTRDAKVEVRRPERLPTSDPYWFAFQVYRHTLSSQDGVRCAHSPTCSLYGVQAVRRHRVMGFFLAVDRLWRQGRSSELRPLPRQYGGEIVRYFDPLDASDFWLRGLEGSHAGELVPPVVRQ
jgi:hypothetical protein